MAVRLMRGQLSWLARSRVGSLSVSSVHNGLSMLPKRNDMRGYLTYFEERILLEERA